MVDLKPIVSKSVDAYRYDPQTLTLRIQYKSGPTWDYFNVPQSMIKELEEDPSFGSYLHHNIKKNFQAQKVQ